MISTKTPSPKVTQVGIHLESGEKAKAGPKIYQDGIHLIREREGVY